MQKWKIDSSLYSCERKDGKKNLDYHSVYVDEFCNSDKLQDWESIDRCKNLWFWATNKSNWGNIDKWNVLDAGTKDCQFPVFLQPMVENVIGIEISKKYIEYAQEKNRPAIYGDVCNLPKKWTDKFDCVFSHHLLGLTSDIQKAVEEMYSVTKPGGYIITLTQIPGNKKKHYSYIDSPDIFDEFIENNQCKVIYNDHLDIGFENEFVMFIQKEF